MTATVAGIHLGIDTHANRPAANTVPDGSIYSCSTHSLVYKSNFAGNSWATWATLGSSGGVTPSTLGTTSVGASFDTRGMKIKKITLATAGLLASINAHVKGNGTNQHTMVGVLYSDSGGNPTNVMAAIGTPVTATPTRTFQWNLNTTARWVTFPVGRWLAAGDYWIGVWFNEGTGTQQVIAYDSGTGSDRTVAGGLQNEPVDSSIQAISTGTNDYSIYADIIR